MTLTLYFSIILVLNITVLYICVITQYIRGLRTNLKVSFLDQKLYEKIKELETKHSESTTDIIYLIKMMKSDMDSTFDNMRNKFDIGHTIRLLEDIISKNRTETDFKIKIMKSDLDSTLSNLKELEENYYTNFMHNSIFTIDNDYDKLSKGQGPHFYQYTVPEIKKMISYNLYSPHMLYTQTNTEVLKELLGTGLNIDENSVYGYKGNPLGERRLSENGHETYTTPLVYTFKRDVVVDHYEDVNRSYKVRYTKTNYEVIKFFIKQGANTDVEVTDLDGRSKIKLVDHPAMLIPEMILLIDSMKSK